MDNKGITYANKVVKDMENRKDKIHDLVIEKYADIAKGEDQGCLCLMLHRASNFPDFP